MSVTLLTLIGWGVLVIAGYFALKFTFDFVMKKIDQYFTEREIDTVFVTEIPKMMEDCKKKGNVRSYDTLKKAWEKGYTYITAKTAGGKIKDGVEAYIDTSKTPDQRVKDLLGDEKAIVIER